jgi:hypothetical protein
MELKYSESCKNTNIFRNAIHLINSMSRFFIPTACYRLKKKKATLQYDHYTMKLLSRHPRMSANVLQAVCEQVNQNNKISYIAYRQDNS